MATDNNSVVFYELLKAGLWEKEARLSQFGEIDYDAIMRLAEEQSVVGLVTAGLEQVKDLKVPQAWILQFISSTLQIEQQNKSMNEFVAKLIESLRISGVYTLLVKGHGVAQCYERPLWRSCGDVDLFLSDDNFQKAKKCLIPQATTVEQEVEYDKHLGMTIDGWTVELHGNLRGGLSARMDKVLDDIVNDTFYKGDVCSWMNGQTQVFLLSKENAVLFVFAHYLKHFFKEGLGIRQICDWSRLLWTYKDSLNHSVIEKRIKKMGLMTEWHAFGAFSTKYLGMPAEAIPLFDSQASVHSVQLQKKADLINEYILMVGNMDITRI